tara:strand:+ start:1365 stop:1946 length:582 start_codon:yes stop_codon:yes gene_type:complete
MEEDRTQEELVNQEQDVTEIDVESMTTDQLKEILELTQKTAADQLDAAQRAQAELANYKKRTEEQRITDIQFLNANLLSKLLPVSDEFEMAIKQYDTYHLNEITDTNDPESQWVEGIKLIHKKLEVFLSSEGVTKIECEGQMFDPLQHEALSTEETNEYESGVVTQVLRNGYKLKDRVIQPAQVVVAKPVTNL